jgi:PleD family two-component response regulator
VPESSAPSAGSLLVVDHDEVILRLLRFNLERAGYAVRAARTAAEGLELARQDAPDLILSETRLPDLDGLKFSRQLMEGSRTRHIPIILMSGDGGPAELVAALEAGADDYLYKPLDFREVTARVRALIRRAQLKPALSPLTGLPGNLIIEQEIRQVTAPGRGAFAVLYADFNNFKAYNDVYGFPAGDEAIRLAAQVLTSVVGELGNPADFVGHVGGDDFVVITTPDRCDAVAQRVIAEFDRQAPDLYNPADRRRGYLTAKDRQGMIKKFPLLSLAIAIVHNQYHSVASHWEIGEIGAELKHLAKTKTGSAYVKDQRRG